MNAPRNSARPVPVLMPTTASPNGNAATPATEARSAPGDPLMVPIRSLGEKHRRHIGRHLRLLDAHDRYLRFGFAATDEHIDRYINALNFERDEIFGIYNRKLVLIAIAHLAYASGSSRGERAEFGVSVLKASRGRGFGRLLFEHSVMHARNNQVDLLLIHALSENIAMLRIARRAGAIIERDGSESEALLRLPMASFSSRMTEIVEDQFAEIDYQFKAQAKQLHDFLSALQMPRCAVSDSAEPPTSVAEH